MGETPGHKGDGDKAYRKLRRENKVLVPQPPRLFIISRNMIFS
jgi:hypothetical protein